MGIKLGEQRGRPESTVRAIKSVDEKKVLVGESWQKGNSQAVERTWPIDEFSLKKDADAGKMGQFCVYIHERLAIFKLFHKKGETRMYHLIRITGIIIVLALLLAVFVSPAQAGEMAPASAVGDQQPQEVGGLVILVLVGGTAILAGGVLMAKLRSIVS